ncbi:MULTISPECIES: hypothetical protein [unclassified Oceanispirochaeta]|uniref:hypothetical protein n=1 Tax=unclassified Oceanispirochaeta TaxID=2635722 RepID=UPI000E09C6D7|nr:MULTISPECIES: hypothetical protein [unclassified Oceanispirochaeta]MBF9015965.1 hypothetical protein [Oceanispirochaeta sp. M2]NPD72428.1 hypothetical protein [Oceanispirochaeta sp. M1]RDG32196.1 hypothetical protein DV872_09970 [Oceanispirochaeta sp. M1]
MELEALFIQTEASRELIQLTLDCHTVAELKSMLKSLSFYSLDKDVTRKDQLAPLAARLYSVPRLFNAFMKDLGEPAEEMIRLCVWDGMQSASDLVTRFDLPFSRGIYGMGELDLPAPFLLKQRSSSPVFIDQRLIPCFRDLMPPPPLDAREFDRAPGDYKFTADQGEEFYLNLNPMIMQLEDLGFFKREADSKILKGTLKTLDKTQEISPLEIDDVESERETNKEDSFTRLKMILSFIRFTVGDTGDAQMMNLTKEPLSFLKEGVKSFFQSSSAHMDLSLLLPEVRVSSKGRYLENCRFYRSRHMPSFYRIFSQWPFRDWVDMKSCVTLFYRMTDARPLMPDMDMYVYEMMGSSYRYREKSYITTELDYKNHIFRPYFRNLFILWAALGLFELSRDSLALDGEGELFLKMSDLGRWVFGLNKHYEEKKGISPSIQMVRLDEAVLVAYVPLSNTSALSFFSGIADGLGEGVFKINEEKLSKSCPVKANLEEKFESVLRYSGQPLPSLWESLRNRMQKRFIQLLVEPDWVVYTLEELGSEVIEYLGSLESPLFSRMEGLRIAVREDNIRSFHNLLRKGGFTPLTSFA